MTSAAGRLHATQGQAAAAPEHDTNAPELTLSGCLMRHDEVPPRSNVRSLNPAIKHSGYLLVDASAVSHHKGVNGMRPTLAASSGHAHTGPETPAVVSGPPNAGDSQMFVVEGLQDGDLEPFTGKRVTLMGVITESPTQHVSTSRPKDGAHDAASFKATMIHPSTSPCRQ